MKKTCSTQYNFMPRQYIVIADLTANLHPLKDASSEIQTSAIALEYSALETNHEMV